MDRARVERAGNGVGEFLVVVCDRAAGAAKRKRRSDHHGIAKLVGESDGFGNVGDDRRRGNFQADSAAGVLEQEAVFGDFDGAKLRADEFDAVFVEDAAFGKLDGEVEARLTTDGRQQGVGPFGGDDGFEILLRERLDVGTVGDFGIRHDRRGIRIDEDDFVALRAQRLAGLRAGVVEFTRLADDDRARADDQNFLDVSAFRHSSSARGLGGRAFFHQRDKIVEEVAGVVRAGRGFGMILHAEKRERAMAQALVRMVVQIQVRDFDVTRWQRIRINAEAVILRSDLDFSGKQILHRMVRAVVAEFQLEGFAAESKAAELVSEADAEDRDAPEQLADICDGVGDRLGVSGAVRKEHAVEA